MRMSRKSLRNAIDLALRRTDGRTFQTFFGKVMKAKHGDDYDPTSPDYTHGDLKCDGLLSNPLTVCACYGPLNAGHDQSEKTMHATADKVVDDFEGALKNWPGMKGWMFAHSFADTPPHFLRRIQELRENHPNLDIKLYGRERFVDDIASLDEDVVEELVGEAALHDAVKNLQPKEVLAVVNTIMAHAATDDTFDEPPKPVPSQKIEFNELGGKRAQRLVEAYANSAQVKSLVADNPNPLLQQRLAAAFQTRYEDLVAQGLSPSVIFDKLIEFGMSGEDFDLDRQAAALSVVAYLFQLCTIFKEPPAEEAA